MENANSKVITGSFGVFSALMGFVVFVLVESVAALATGAVGRFFAQEVVRHGVPATIGIVLFCVLQFNPKIVAWADEVVSELRKIVWPSRKDTFAMTTVVCVMLLISGFVLGLMDVVSASVIDWMLHHNFMGLFS